MGGPLQWRRRGRGRRRRGGQWLVSKKFSRQRGHENIFPFLLHARCSGTRDLADSRVGYELCDFAPFSIVRDQVLFSIFQDWQRRWWDERGWWDGLTPTSSFSNAKSGWIIPSFFPVLSFLTFSTKISITEHTQASNVKERGGPHRIVVVFLTPLLVILIFIMCVMWRRGERKLN